MSNNELFDKGFENRKTVLGAAHVEKSWSSADDFNKPMQALVTEYCWGAVWGDETLPFKTRSLLNIGMLTAMNQHHELGVHVKGALTNGVTVEEIKEILLHATVYSGIPAGLEAFKAAHEVLKAEGALDKGET